MTTFRHLDLFSGIGGFSLAAKWTWGNAHNIVSFCEIDKFCQRILNKHWPQVPIHDDIKTLDATQWRGTIDLLTGGFPCQPYSVAGKRRGSEDDRALWPEMARIIEECRPAWIIAENVAGIVNMELDQVLSDLEGQGYAAWPLVIPACAVDAPHRRDRVWIMALSKQQRLEKPREQHTDLSMQPSEAGTGKESQKGNGNEIMANAISGRCRQDGIGSGLGKVRNGRSNFAMPLAQSSEDVANSSREQLNRSGEAWDGRDESTNGSQSMADTNNTRSQGYRGLQQCSDQFSLGQGSQSEHREWLPEPAVGRTFDGLSRELDKVRGIDENCKANAKEDLQALWCEDVEKAFQWAIGRFVGVSTQKILFAFLCELHERADKSSITMESGENAWQAMRRMWKHIESACSPSRRRYSQQRAQQYSNALRFMSHQASSCYPQAWSSGCWEDGISRVTLKIPNRVDRLRSLGNAIVPQVAQAIMQAIKEMN